MDRRQVRPHNKNDDIEGSQPDTLKRGLTGNRIIDPLDPSYFYPGGTENINTANDPYGLKNCSMSQANFRQASQLGVQALKNQNAQGNSARPQTAKPTGS